jgi:predicted  nucleic acid-binding Zn-ribbon protein
MSGAMAERRRLLDRRLELVGVMCGLNAEALRVLQNLAAIEIDIQRLEAEDDGDAPPAPEQLRAATDEAAALRDAQAACEMRIETVEAEMSEIDRLLAAMTDD